MNQMGVILLMSVGAHLVSSQRSALTSYQLTEGGFSSVTIIMGTDALLLVDPIRTHFFIRGMFGPTLQITFVQFYLSNVFLMACSQLDVITL